MGYYPSSGDQLITEDTPAGTSFLATLQRDGEAITAVASLMGIRVVHLRIPPVIAKTSAQRGINQIGDGRQWMSWVGRDELARIIRFALESKQVTGPVNAVSPNPVRGAEFAAMTAHVLGRKSGPSIPAFLARLLLGEMADEFALASRRIAPIKLLCAGYQFIFPELEQALQHEFGFSGLAGSAGQQIISTYSSRSSTR
jgi:NAD dependent epimerase/dehydratase family enzyme